MNGVGAQVGDDRSRFGNDCDVAQSRLQPALRLIVTSQARRSVRSNEDALKTVKKKFPQATTSTASISWYRSKLRKEDAGVLTNREAREKKGPKG